MRRRHALSTGLLPVLGTLHTGLTPVLYRALTPEAVWFAGTGLGLVPLGAVNRVARQAAPRTPVRRLALTANRALAAFGVLAVIAVPEPQALLVLGAAIGAGVALAARAA